MPTLSRNPVLKKDVLAALRACGIVAVIRTDAPKAIGEAAQALARGGVSFVEITLTTPGALGIIKELVDHPGDERVFIGAGTVLDAKAAQAAIDAGAQFVVSPGFDPEVVSLGNAKGVLTIAGAFTPTEVIRAWKAGADVIKIFPANIGGPDYLKSLKEPLPQIELIPTKGVDFETAGAFLKAGAIAVGVGGTLLSNAQIAAQDYARITENARRFSAIVRDARRIA